MEKVRRARHKPIHRPQIYWHRIFKVGINLSDAIRDADFDAKIFQFIKFFIWIANFRHQMHTKSTNPRPFVCIPATAKHTNPPKTYRFVCNFRHQMHTKSTNPRHFVCISAASKHTNPSKSYWFVCNFRHQMHTNTQK